MNPNRLFIESIGAFVVAFPVIIIFTSGYSDNHIVQSGNLDKDINFIQKRFSENKLARKIRTVLDKTKI